MGGYDRPRDPLFKPVLNNLQGMSRVIAAKGMPPEKANVLTGETEGYSMIGFSAAVVPFLHALDQHLACRPAIQTCPGSF